jgi:hypothetical protein
MSDKNYRAHVQRKPPGVASRRCSWKKSADDVAAVYHRLLTWSPRLAADPISLLQPTRAALPNTVNASAKAQLRLLLDTTVLSSLSCPLLGYVSLLLAYVHRINTRCTFFF